MRDRAYSRESDVDAEGGTLLTPGDKLEKQLANLKDWVSDLDAKVDKLSEQGCSHRGNDLAKLARIESSTDEFRKEASGIKDSIFQLSLSFASYKTEVVNSTHLSDTKINNLKLGILVQCLLLLVVIVGFLFKEFTLPSLRNPSYYSESKGRNQVVVDSETWDKIVRDKIESSKK